VTPKRPDATCCILLLASGCSAPAFTALAAVAARRAGSSRRSTPRLPPRSARRVDYGASRSDEGWPRAVRLSSGIGVRPRCSAQGGRGFRGGLAALHQLGVASVCAVNAAWSAPSAPLFRRPPKPASVAFLHQPTTSCSRPDHLRAERRAARPPRRALVEPIAIQLGVPGVAPFAFGTPRCDATPARRVPDQLR